MTAVSGEINIARGKPTAHSSEGGKGPSAFRAVDGNVSPYWDDASCSRTKAESKLKHL